MNSNCLFLVETLSNGNRKRYRIEDNDVYAFLTSDSSNIEGSTTVKRTEDVAQHERVIFRLVFEPPVCRLETAVEHITVIPPHFDGSPRTRQSLGRVQLPPSDTNTRNFVYLRHEDSIEIGDRRYSVQLSHAREVQVDSSQPYGAAQGAGDSHEKPKKDERSESVWKADQFQVHEPRQGASASLQSGTPDAQTSSKLVEETPALKSRHRDVLANTDNVKLPRHRDVVTAPVKNTSQLNSLDEEVLIKEESQASQHVQSSPPKEAARQTPLCSLLAVEDSFVVDEHASSEHTQRIRNDGMEESHMSVDVADIYAVAEVDGHSSAERMEDTTKGEGSPKEDVSQLGEPVSSKPLTPQPSFRITTDQLGHNTIARGDTTKTNDIVDSEPIGSLPRKRKPMNAKGNNAGSRKKTTRLNSSTSQERDIAPDHSAATVAPSQPISSATSSKSSIPSVEEGQSGHVNFNENPNDSVHRTRSRTTRNSKVVRDASPSSSDIASRSGRGSSQRGARSPYQPIAPRIMFSYSESLNRTSHVSSLREHGVTIVNEPGPDTFDMLVVGKGELKRTTKVLFALALGKMIVTDDWVEKSIKAGELLATARFAPKNLVRGGQQDVQDASKDRKSLFVGKTMYITPALKKDFGNNYKDIVALMVVCGAKDTFSRPARDFNKSDDTIALGLGQGDIDAMSLMEHGENCYSKELVTISIMRGEVDFQSEEFRLESSQSQSPRRRGGEYPI